MNFCLQQSITASFTATRDDSGGKASEVFVLDMGKPVKILDLAKRMVEVFVLRVIDKSCPQGGVERNNRPTPGRKGLRRAPHRRQLAAPRASSRPAKKSCIGPSFNRKYMPCTSLPTTMTSKPSAACSKNSLSATNLFLEKMVW